MSFSTNTTTLANTCDDSQSLASPAKHKEQSVCAANVAATITRDAKFVKASEFAASITIDAKIGQEEITDDELLQMAIEFEKKHLESVPIVKK